MLLLCYFIIVIIIYIIFFTVLTVQALFGSGPYAIIGLHYTLTCTIANDTGLIAQVSIHSDKFRTPYYFIQHGGNCTILLPDKWGYNYNGTCGNGTKKEYSPTRDYYMVIHEMALEDARSKWWCKTSSHYITDTGEKIGLHARSMYYILG